MAIHRYYRPACTGRGKGRVGNHLLDRLNTGDRLFRKRETQSDGAEQFAVNVNRTSAHALHDASFLERAAAQASQYDALLRSEIFHYSEDFDLEIFDAIVMEDSAADAVHAGPDIVKGEELL
jgi:hypothetical protein